MINFYKFIRICGADPENAVYPYVYYRQESYMNQEHEIVESGSPWPGAREEADRLVRDYLPFIKAETAKFLHRPPVEGQDDELSIAMFSAFYEAVRIYEKARGTFLAFASLGIRNRLIDHYRKESRHGKVISFDQPDSKDEDRTLLDTLESGESNVEEGQIRMAAREEIEEYARGPAEFGISLTDVADNCPKQDRTLRPAIRRWPAQKKIHGFWNGFLPPGNSRSRILRSCPECPGRRWSGTGSISPLCSWLIPMAMRSSAGICARYPWGKEADGLEISSNGMRIQLRGGAGSAGKIPEGSESGLCSGTEGGRC